MTRDVTDLLIQLQNEAHGGPSPFGLSRYKSLRSQAKAIEEHGASYVPNPYDPSVQPTKLSYLHAGIYGHKLFDCRIKGILGQHDDVVWDARTEAFNPSFREGLRLYRNFHNHWGSLEEYLGCRVVGSEVGLGTEGSLQMLIHERLGGPLTGRADAIVDITDPATCAKNTGMHVMPGRWIIDYKFGRKHDKRDENTYVKGPQCQNYLYLDELERPSNGAVGMLFLRIVGEPEAMSRDTNYAVYMGLPHPEAEEMLRGVVTQGQKDIETIAEWERNYIPTEPVAA